MQNCFRFNCWASSLTALIQLEIIFSRFLTTQTGLSADKPYLDPCLPGGLSDTVVRDNRTLYLRGQGDWTRCQEAVRPFLGLHNGTMSPGGVYQVTSLNETLRHYDLIWGVLPSWWLNFNSVLFFFPGSHQLQQQWVLRVLRVLLLHGGRAEVGRTVRQREVLPSCDGIHIQLLISKPEDRCDVLSCS